MTITDPESPPRAIRREPHRLYDGPDPEGWSAAELTDAERVDDLFIARDATRVYDPLQPEQEQLFAAAADVPRTARLIVTFADLVAIARRTGVKVVEAPSSWRGKRGEMGMVEGVTCHWTGTPNSYRPELEYPDYNVVKEGRAGLDNSLSAYGLGRYTTIYVFSEDISWHAGTWSWAGITDGNGHFVGIEPAGAGDWTPFERRVYPRLVASILLFIRAPITMAPTHAQGAMPRGRKSDFPAEGDIWGQDLPGGPRDFHDSVSWLMAHPEFININYQPTIPEDDDMPTAKEVAAEVVAQLREADMSPATGTQTFQNLLSQIHTAVVRASDSLVLDEEDKPVVKADLLGFVKYIDRHAYELNREKVPEVIETLETIKDQLQQLLDGPTTG